MGARHALIWSRVRVRAWAKEFSSGIPNAVATTVCSFRDASHLSTVQLCALLQEGSPSSAAAVFRVTAVAAGAAALLSARRGRPAGGCFGALTFGDADRARGFAVGGMDGLSTPNRVLVGWEPNS